MIYLIKIENYLFSYYYFLFQEDDEFTRDNDAESSDETDTIKSEETANAATVLFGTVRQNIFRIPPPQDIKKRRLEQVNEAFKTMKEIRETASKRDEFTVFGELMANKLRKFSGSPRNIAIA